MHRWVRPLALSALAFGMHVPPAHTGGNPDAHSRLYWLGAGGASTADTSRAGVARLIVTMKGVSTFRGADVQIAFYGFYGSGHTLAPSWQLQPGGCAYSNFTVSRHFPDPFPCAFDSLAHVADTHLEMGYGATANPCARPDIGFLWLSSRGSAGVALDPAKEYGLYVIEVDQTTGCPGDLTDPGGPTPVCILISHGCGNTYNGPRSGDDTVIGILDGNGINDWAHTGSELEWGSEEGPGAWSPAHGFNCFTDAVRVVSWGRLKRLYR